MVVGRWVRCGALVVVLALGAAAAASGATPGESTSAWASRLLSGQGAVVEDVRCGGTTPMLERYGQWLDSASGRDGAPASADGGLGVTDASVSMMRLAMTMGIERLAADWEEGGDWPAAGQVPPYAVENLGRRVDPARVRRAAATVLGLRRVIVPVHGADMGVRARLVILSLLRQVLVSDARAGLFPDPLAVRDRRDMLTLLDAVLVGFSTDDEAGRGLPPDLYEAGLKRLAWLDGMVPLLARRVAQTPAALTSLARTLSARAPVADRLREDELKRFEELTRAVLPPAEVFALPPRERLQRLEGWRPHLNARTREGEFWPADHEGSEGDRPRALLRAMLAPMELTDDCCRELRLQAHVRALVVAWGASDFRQRHARAPATWEELGPFVPQRFRVDPINGGLLRFGPGQGKATEVWSDSFRETPGGWPGDEGCLALVPRYGDTFGDLLR